mmetsp:Transcript_27691/g.45790  ORF Transcript_27691/g.45790 Transcript_27691/m.45790 type:complete len:526 (+) Transcript_27691:94-1671(+)
MTFAGNPSLVSCAENLDATSANCTGMRLCVVSSSTHEDALANLLPNAPLIRAASTSSIFQNYRQNLCQVIVGETADISEAVARDLGIDGEYAVSSNLYSKEPLAFVTRDGDPQWSDFVNWVLQGLFHAEEISITQSTAALLGTTTVFGEEFSNMIIDAVSAVGNYAELYDRHLEDIVPRQTNGPNTINTGSSGLMYSMPFGNPNRGAVPPSDEQNPSRLEIIRERGFLRCGISERAIFAIQDPDTGEWSGQDVDFCRALSAAIFDGVTNTVRFTSLSATDRFGALQQGDVDVLSRITTVTLARDVLEPSTGQGFSFAQPNFYDGLSFGGIPPYGDCADTLDTRSDQCTDLRICVTEGTTFFQRLSDIFPSENIVPWSADLFVVQGLQEGACNAVAGGIIDVSRTNVVTNGGYTGPYQIGSSRLTKDPLALVTLQDDQLWSSFVYWVNSALVYAEEAGIDSASSNDMPLISLFGDSYTRMLREAVAAVGNFGEIYNRNVEADVPRGGLNELNAVPYGPQLYPLPGL